MSCYLDENIRIAYNFPTDNATLTSVTSESGNMLGEYVQNQQPSELWRSTDLTDQWFVFQLSTLSQLSSIIIYNHNLTVGSEVELVIATDSGFTNIVYENIWEGFTPTYGWDEEPLGWDTVGWDGYSDEILPLNFFVKYFEKVAGLYVKVRLSDNNSDGFIQAGRVIVANSYQFNYNFSKDITLSKQDTSISSLTEGGATRSNQGVSIRKLALTFPNATEEDSNILSEIYQFCSRNTNLFVDCYPLKNTTQAIRYKMLGFLNTDYQEKRLTPQLQAFPSINITEAK